MKYKLIIAPGNLQKYAELQSQHIQQAFPELSVEIVDTKSDYVKLYNKKPNRFPFILLLKHGAYKSSINAKLDNQNLQQWLITNHVK